jgi:hypothetical protein
MRLLVIQFFLLFAALATQATRLEIPTVRVVDSRGKALLSAVVYLYDHRTKMVRTHWPATMVDTASAR